jgi:hypothetical protein
MSKWLENGIGPIWLTNQWSCADASPAAAHWNSIKASAIVKAALGFRIARSGWEER